MKKALKVFTYLKTYWKKYSFSTYYPLIFTSVFIFIIIQYSFTALDTLFYDFWIKLDRFSKVSSDIVIVYLDKESDQFLGEEYPYTYASHKRALERILGNSPKQIHYLATLPQVDNPQEVENQNDFHQFLRESKTPLSPLWIGVQNIQNFIETTSQGYKTEIFPLPHFFGSKFNQDYAIRRIVLNQSGENTLFLKSLIHKKQEKVSAKSIKGSYYNKRSDSTYTLFKYARGAYESIPFHRTVVGYFPQNFFKDKIVIVGSQYLSNPKDFLLTPISKGVDGRTSKLQIIAQMIQALQSGRTVEILPNILSKILAVFISLLLSIIISRIRPTKGLLIIISLFFGVFLLSFILFFIGGFWINISYIIISIFAVYYIWVPFRAIAEYQTRYAIEKETKILRKVDHLKKNFISLMSHDLKTPVAKIAGIADLLNVQYENSEHQSNMLKNIIDSTKELNKFINSILDLTKIESQNFEIKKLSQDVNSILESTIERLSFEAQKSNITISKTLEPLYPIKIDPNLIGRVISNLLENAIKYSGKNSQVLVKSWDDPEWVYIQISDTGKGMTQENLQNIFEKFYRVKNDSTHVIKGSGLGLYLVKYFVELHNGSISVTSEPKKGTSFTVKLQNK